MPRHLVRHVARGARNTAQGIARHVSRHRSGALAVAAGAAGQLGNAYKRYKKQPGKSKPGAKKTMRGNPGAAHSGLGVSTVRLGKGRKAKLLKRQKTIGRWRYTQTNSRILIGNAGQQQISDLIAVATTQKILVSSGPGYTIEQNDVALEQLNPYLSSTGSAYLAAQQTPLNDQFIILAASLEIEMTSFTAVGTFADIYIVSCKKATSMSPSTAWIQGLVAQRAGQTDQAFAGPGSAGGGVVGAIQSLMPHTKPSESRLFSEYWKVEAVKSFQFTGNSTERLNVDFNIQRKIKMINVRQYNSQSNFFMPGLTHYVMIVQRGAIVLDVTASVAAERPTYGSTKLGVVVIEKYTMCGIMGNTGRLDISTGFSNLPLNATLANQTLLSEIDTSITAFAGTVA